MIEPLIQIETISLNITPKMASEGTRIGVFVNKVANLLAESTTLAHKEGTRKNTASMSGAFYALFNRDANPEAVFFTARNQCTRPDWFCQNPPVKMKLTITADPTIKTISIAHIS